MTDNLPFSVGFELEFGLEIPASLNRIKDALEAQRHVVNCEASYRHTPKDNRYWDLKTDSSCGVNGAMGYEAASPVCFTKQQLLEACAAAGVIAQCGAVVSKRCGLHVHFGFKHASPESMDNLVRFMTRYEEAFYMLVPLGRRINRYCRRIDEKYVSDYTSLSRRSSDTTATVVRAFQGRHHWINFQPLKRQGTIEFRFMPGSLSPDHIYNYVMFLEHVLNTVVKGKRVSWGKAAAKDELMLFRTMLQQAGFYGKDSKVNEERAVAGRNWAMKQYRECLSTTIDELDQELSQPREVSAGLCAGTVDMTCAGTVETVDITSPSREQTLGQAAVEYATHAVYQEIPERREVSSGFSREQLISEVRQTAASWQFPEMGLREPRTPPQSPEVNSLIEELGRTGGQHE